jgi:L-asparaginase
MKKLPQVMIIATGGTIDKSYGVGAGVRDLSFSGLPAVAEILRRIVSVGDYPIVPVMAKDSLDMNSQDRATIAAMCASVPYSRILITHGTDTMHKTAAAIVAKRLRKTIVITGAGQPAVTQGTDADFNVGFALASALTAASGVYVAMNVRLYPWNKFKKNPVTGVFEPA